MASTYFISDLHLDAARPHVLDGLAAFLQRIGHCDTLYILGDLFEAWVGDDDTAALATDTAALLKEFVAGGTPLYIMVGNRDFLLGEQFAARCGASIIEDPSLILLYGTLTVLLHGDSLCTADAEYQVFRAQSRDPQWQAQMLERPLTERRDIARTLREISHEALTNKAQDITDVDEETVNAVAQQYKATRLIHGHTHRPKHHTTAFGERWVLGDWDDVGWALEAKPEGLNLFQFPLPQ